MAIINNLDSDTQGGNAAPRAVLTARALSRRRRRNQQRTRDITRAERREMMSLKKKARRIITSVRPGFATKQAGPITESFTFGSYVENVICEMYLPDKDKRDSLIPLACNVNGLTNATDGKQACIFALGVLCCVNDKFENDLPDKIARIGFNITTIRLPSQAEEYGIEYDDVGMLDAASYLVIFGLTVLFIFKNATAQNINHFFTVRVGGLKAAAGVDPGTDILNPYNLSKAQSVRAILGSSLHLKRKLIHMIIAMQNEDDNAGAVCRYVGTILEYNEMSAVMFPFETLVTTSSIILTDNRVLGEMMALSEALELMSQSDMPQFFRYLAPPDQAVRLERARFPTLAAVGQKLKQEFMKQDSVKNLVGMKGSVGTLAEELCNRHKKYLARKKPITLDVLAKQICQPAGATILGDDEDEDSEDEEEEEDILGDD